MTATPPSGSSSPAPTPSGEACVAKAPPARILVVDDSPFSRAFAMATLRRAKYEVAGAESAAQAEELLRTQRFDLAILDIVMPGVDGFELLDRLKRCDPDMPVIMMTGVGSLETAIVAMQRKAADYLLKPIDPAVLLASVERVIKERNLREAVGVYELSKAVVGSVRCEELLPRLAEAARAALRCRVAAVVCCDGVTIAPEAAATPEHEALARELAKAAVTAAVPIRPALPAGSGFSGAAVIRIATRRAPGPCLVLLRDGELRDASFTAREDRLLELLASIAKLAFDNAELYGELEKSLATIRETHARLASAERLSAIGELAAGVAHELNNPLTGILGLAELLAADLAGTKHAEDLETIRKSALRCRAIIQDLIAFARKRVVATDPVGLRAVLEHVIAVEAENCARAGIVVKLEVDPAMRPVPANALELQQVFANLLSNARDAVTGMGRPGRIEVRASAPSARVVRVEVADNGPGVPPAIRSRIFEPFFTTKEVGAGTGLGLAVAHGIVRRLGGSIEVGDAPGGGALFRVELPAA